MTLEAMEAPVRKPRERVWDEIRAAKGEFTLEQVAYAADMKIDSARDYLTGLRRAGFIVETRREAKPLTVGGNTKQVYYALVNDVGHVVDNSLLLVQRLFITTFPYQPLAARE